MTQAPVAAEFSATLAKHGLSLTRSETVTLQINVGKLCNQACHHCHVDAGPQRMEIMTRETIDKILDFVGRHPNIKTVDITGGAPELNPSFDYFVENLSTMGRQIVDRCNLTVIFVAGKDYLPEFLARHKIQLVCSLPCYSAKNVDQQRGHGVFDKSIRALQLFNALGYGVAGSGLNLDLVYNPLGAFLPPPQEKLETDYKRELNQLFGIVFNHLYAMINMPISRFLEDLRRHNRYEAYMSLLLENFNPETVSGLMCRHLLSVDWQGDVYDCDFNQMLEMAIVDSGHHVKIWNIHEEDVKKRSIITGSHCFGCTAGAGSSCGGALMP